MGYCEGGEGRGREGKGGEGRGREGKGGGHRGRAGKGGKGREAPCIHAHPEIVGYMNGTRECFSHLFPTLCFPPPCVTFHTHLISATPPPSLASLECNPPPSIPLPHAPLPRPPQAPRGAGAHPLCAGSPGGAGGGGAAAAAAGVARHHPHQGAADAGVCGAWGGLCVCACASTNLATIPRAIPPIAATSPHLTLPPLPLSLPAPAPAPPCPCHPSLPLPAPAPAFTHTPPPMYPPPTHTHAHPPAPPIRWW